MTRGYHRSRGGGPSQEQMADMLTRNMMPPTLFNGIYTFAGGQISFRTHASTVPVETPPNPQLAAYGGMMQPGMMTQPGMEMMDPSMMQMNMMMQQQTNQSLIYGASMQTNLITVGGFNNGGAFIQQANITIAGTKTKSTNVCCMVSTLVCSCCIFPLCFMCCAWWKKIVFPRFELSVQAYHDIGRFMQNNQTITNLTLTVFDNSFNAEKANILCQIIKLSHLTGFTFVNKASQVNHLQNEVDNFTCNVAPIKSLGIGTSLTWGDIIA